jgi:hypothetical protein
VTIAAINFAAVGVAMLLALVAGLAVGILVDELPKRTPTTRPPHGDRGSNVQRAPTRGAQRKSSLETSVGASP